MDGLSILFAVLTGIFLLVVFGMNILSNKVIGTPEQEGFEDITPPPKEEKGQSASKFEPMVRAVLDPLALYTSPDGKQIPEGQTLCELFVLIRKSLADNIKGESGTISDSELMKKVEAEINSKMPLPALPCPLLKYPNSTATDKEWFEWVQEVPLDFGARVVFMAAYADITITNIAQMMKDALSGNIKQEGFQDDMSICTPQLAEKKREDAKAAQCILPESISPAQYEDLIQKRLKKIQSEKVRLLERGAKDPKAVKVGDPLLHIQNAKKGADYLNAKKKKAQDGTLAEDLTIPPEPVQTTRAATMG